MQLDYEPFTSKYDTEKIHLLNLFFPMKKIGIVHLAAGLWKNNKDMRLNKNIKVELKTCR